LDSIPGKMILMLDLTLRGLDLASNQTSPSDLQTVLENKNTKNTDIQKINKTQVRKPKNFTDLCTRMTDLSDLESVSPTPLPNLII